MPDYRLVAKNFRLAARRVAKRRFGGSNDLTSSVDRAGSTVVAAQCRQRAHATVLPNEGSARGVSSKRTIVLTIRIRLVRLRRAGYCIDGGRAADREAVRTAECAQVTHLAVAPDKCVYRAVGPHGKTD